MRVIVITPPEPVVTWEEADAHLRLAGDEEQKPYVESLIAAATANVDGPAGWLGRALGVQVLEARFSLNVGGPFILPYPPVASLVSAKYLDAAGNEQTAENDDFELLGNELVPAGSSWPWEGGSLRREAGRVQYRAGYESVPAPIKTAILLMVSELFHNRELTAGDVAKVGEPLLQPYRIYS
ncbi:hypothetical protein [Sphingobium sp. LSP13-1-1.1]|uniref:hypothetical protein n=1 Tax=Sphingobium sp. LSP13-1-1.1 TaxID=3135234 RepID=UPI003412788C